MNSFEIRTVQSGALKIYFAAISKILKTGNLIINETGIKMLKVQDELLLHTRLLAENFEEYIVSEEIKLNVDFVNLSKIMKTSSNNDTVTLMKKEGDNFWSIELRDWEKGKTKTFNIKMHNAEYDQEIYIPPAEFDTELTMPTTDFQKMMKEMKLAGSDRLEIISTTAQELIFQCDGKNIMQKYTLSETENSLEYKQYKNEEIHEGFSYKLLTLCLGFTNLCNLIHMYIKPDYPLIISYSVANLGDIKLCFAPMTDGDKSISENMSAEATTENR